MLPKNLKYGSKVESAIARSSRVNIAPQGPTTYGLGDTIILNIPTRKNLVLATTESYLRFTCSLQAQINDTAFRWDSCGAHGVIQRIRIFHGSNLLEDIDNYGLLAKVLFDLQQPLDSIIGKQNMMVGTRADTVVTTAAATYVQNASLAVLNINSGERVGGPGALTAANGVVEETYCLNLVSLIGSLCSQNYLPCFAMTSAPLRVEIQLVDNLCKACSVVASTSTANTGLMTLKNVEYVANMIELGDSAMSVIYNSLEGQPLQFCIPQFRNYAFGQQLQTTQTECVIPIPAKFSSLKSLLTTVRQNGTGTFGGAFPFSSTKSALTQYQYRIGASIVPAKAPSLPVEFYTEALKAMGSISDIHYQPALDKASYILDDPVNSNDTATSVSSRHSGSFVIGLDLENYPDTGSARDTLFSGANTNTDDIFLTATFAGGRGNAVQTRFDTFANFDAVLVFENDTGYIKF